MRLTKAFLMLTMMLLIALAEGHSGTIIDELTAVDVGRAKDGPR
jgi:hypothetical protein